MGADAELIVKLTIVRLLLHDFEWRRSETRRRKQHHTLLTDHRDCIAIMNEICDSVVAYYSVPHSTIYLGSKLNGHFSTICQAVHNDANLVN